MSTNYWWNSVDMNNYLIFSSKSGYQETRNLLWGATETPLELATGNLS